MSLLSSVAHGARPERPAASLRWTDAHHAPPGDFAARAIVNAAVTESVVPERGESWDIVSEFALSYDGYAYWDDLPELAGRVLQGWTRDRHLPESLDELRACLFYEHRRWHHFGQDPAGRSAGYIWALLEAVADVVSAFDSVAGALTDPRPRRAPEAHVRILPAPPHGASAAPSPAPAPLPRRRTATSSPLGVMGVGAVSGGGVDTVEQPPAARAHVRLVTAIESGSGLAAAVASRHPSVWQRAHEATASSTLRELRPMPSADPLPKPPVIERRTDAASRRAPDGPRRSRPIAPLRTSGAHPAVMTVRSFADDGGDYRRWMATHPEGFVLNRPRAARAGAMTMHRVGCPALGQLVSGGASAARTGSPKVCAPDAGSLAAWSRARGEGDPVPCRRCQP